MKRITALLMALAMLFALTACGQAEAPAASEAPAGASAAPAEESAAVASGVEEDVYKRQIKSLPPAEEKNSA